MVETKNKTEQEETNERSRSQSLLDQIGDWLKKITAPSSRDQSLEDVVDELAGYYAEVLRLERNGATEPVAGTGEASPAADTSTADSSTPEKPKWWKKWPSAATESTTESSQQTSATSEAAHQDTTESVAQPAEATGEQPAQDSASASESHGADQQKIELLNHINAAAKRLGPAFGVDPVVMVQQARTRALVRQGQGATVTTPAGRDMPTLNDSFSNAAQRSRGQEADALAWFKQRIGEAALGNGLAVTEAGDPVLEQAGPALTVTDSGAYEVSFMDAASGERQYIGVDEFLTEPGRSALTLAEQAGPTGIFDPAEIGRERAAPEYQGSAAAAVGLYEHTMEQQLEATADGVTGDTESPEQSPSMTPDNAPTPTA